MNGACSSDKTSSSSKVSKLFLKVSIFQRAFYQIGRSIDSADGKDKALKVIQYTAKLIVAKKSILSPFFISPHIIKALQWLTKELSLSRRVLRLGREVPSFVCFLETIESVNDSSSKKEKESLLKVVVQSNLWQVFVTFCSFINDILDSILTVIKLTHLDYPKFSHNGEKLSSVLWLTTAVMDIIEIFSRIFDYFLAQDIKSSNGVKEPLVEEDRFVHDVPNGMTKLEVKRIRDKFCIMYLFSSSSISISTLIKNTFQLIKKCPSDLKLRLLFVSFLKTFFDIIFCYIDVVEADNLPQLQLLSGWLSGILGFYKIWKKSNPSS